MLGIHASFFKVSAKFNTFGVLKTEPTEESIIFVGVRDGDKYDESAMAISLTVARTGLGSLAAISAASASQVGRWASACSFLHLWLQ